MTTSRFIEQFRTTKPGWLFSLVELLESSTGFQHVVPVAKGADPNKTFTSGPKPTARCGDNMGLLKNLTEHIP